MQEEGNGDNARVRWLKQHTLGATSTIPEQFEELIVLGATAHLTTSASVSTVDKATISGRYATADFQAWARERLHQYNTQLKQIARDNRVVQKELYSD